MRRGIAVALVVVLVLAVGGAVAYTPLFTAEAGVTYESPDGLVVTAGVDHGVNESNPFLDNDTIYLDGVQFNASAVTSVTVSEFRGANTSLSAVDSANGTVSVNPDDKSEVDISGNVTALSWRDAAIDGNRVMTYSATGGGAVVIDGLPPGTDYVASTAGGTILTSGTTTGGGEATVDVVSGNDTDVLFFTPRPPAADSLSPNATTIQPTEATLSVNVTDPDFQYAAGDNVTVTFHLNGAEVDTQHVTSNGTVTYATGDVLNEGTNTWNVTMADEYNNTASSAEASFTVEQHAPVLSNASPTGDLSTLDVNLSVDVADRDFADSTGDSVTVDFYRNGALVGSDTLTSNGTASAPLTNVTGGTTTWRADATDGDGKTATTGNLTFNAPAELEIRNETANPNTGVHELLNNTDVELEFYFDYDSQPDLIVQRNSSNGTLDMTGLPVGDPFVVVASADGYFNRRIFVESLFETQTIYMLNENETAVQPTFRLVDFTGRYDREVTVLEIQRAINGSWRTVEGDYFGAANQVTAQLAFNERHRLVITNTRTGDTRELGAFTPTATSTFDLEVHQDDDLDEQRFDPSARYHPDVGSLPARDNVSVNATLSPGAKLLDSYTLVAVDNGTELLNTSGSSPDGSTLSGALNLSNASGRNVTLYVNWSASDNTSGVLSRTYSVRESFQNDYALLPTVINADMGGPTPNALSALIVVLLAVFATGYAATTMGSGPSGLIGLAVVSLGALIGYVPFGWLIAGAIAWLVFSGVRNRI